MHLKRFRGRQMQDVMRQAREELGPGAVILHTRPARSRGLLRFFRGKGVELVAAIDDAPAAPPASRPVSGATSPGGPRVPAPAGGDELRADLAELRELVLRLGGARLVPPSLLPAWERLVAAGLDHPLALEVVRTMAPAGSGGAIPAGDALTRGLEERIAAMVRVAGSPLPPRPGVVALVGPPGAGKTLTLSKLAAHAHLAGTTTEVLSLDGSSLGARGHLETLSDVLGVPCALAPTREDLAARIEGGLSRGLVLIDTPGVSPMDEAGMTALDGLLRMVHPTDVHLVLPATSKTADALAAVRAFARLGVTHLVFTRLDETGTSGSVIGVCAGAGLPLSYVGTGREIPHDIRPACARELLRHALQGPPGPGGRPA